MSHMVETMAFAGDVPWHGLGKRVPADLSPEQMLEAAGLNWRVNKIPAYAEVGGRQIDVGRCALVRDSDNTVLDVVGSAWNPVQNEEAFDFFHDFVAAGDMEMHTAGSLRDGQIVWALAKVHDGFKLFGQDEVESYLLFTNPHRFGQSIDVRFTPIRVVCNNTLTLSLGQEATNVAKVSHRRMFVADEVKTTLGIAREKLAAYKEMGAFLGKKRFTDKTIVEYFKQLFPHTQEKEKQKELEASGKKGGKIITFPMSRAAERAMKILPTQPGAKYGEGTFWQAFNTVTFMTDHVLGRSADTRLQSAWFGQNRNLKTRALELAVEMAKAA